MINATAAILTKNSGIGIRKCLESVKLFSEVIILDGNSLDSTLSVCKEYKCKIFKQPNYIKFRNGTIKNFAEARNILLRISKNNLILFLDSDEFLSKKLIDRIKFLAKTTYNKIKYNQIIIKRKGRFKNVFLDKTLSISNSQPRVFFKNANFKFIKNVHEKLILCNGQVKSKKLSSDEFISFNYINSFLKLKKKNNYYYKIEKKFIVTKKNFNSLKFIFFRISVNIISFLKLIFNFFSIKDKFFFKLQVYNTYLQIKYALKLFF